MRAHFLTVDEHLGLPVHSVEVEHYPPAAPRSRDTESPSVPKRIVRRNGPSYSGKRGLDTKRNEYAPVRLAEAFGLRRGDGILPHSVKRLPFLPHQLRARILRVDAGRRHLRRPARPDVVPSRRPVILNFGSTRSCHTGNDYARRPGNQTNHFHSHLLLT